MKILPAQQIREADAYTITHEPIASLDLMERAARAFADWFAGRFPDTQAPVYIACGTGNNGGDGLAVARLLHGLFYEVTVLLCSTGGPLSPDCQTNLERLPGFGGVPQVSVAPGTPLPPIPESAILIDALFGSGLNRPLQGFWGETVAALSLHRGPKVSIDLPSGLYADRPSEGVVFEADDTLSFEMPKLAFFFPENERYVGEWSVLPIGLHPGFLESVPCTHFWTTPREARSLLRPRRRFSHKGSYGHALLVCGSSGMAGAAILSARACLRSGTGLLTVHSPANNRIPLQTAVPEAMFHADAHPDCWTVPYLPSGTSAIGIGCGIGMAPESAAALEHLLASGLPLLLDADALNLIARQGWQERIPKNAVLTPHPKEFERLFGPSANGFERLARQRQKAMDLGVVILLKGAFSAICLPDGSCHFNSSGNPGMATAGSGDVLSGIISGLLAQGYAPAEAAILGAYLHGRAGDLAAAALGQQALIAGDIIEYLGAAFLE